MPARTFFLVFLTKYFSECPNPRNLLCPENVLFACLVCVKLDTKLIKIIRFQISWHKKKHNLLDIELQCHFLLIWKQNCGFHYNFLPKFFSTLCVCVCVCMRVCVFVFPFTVKTEQNYKCNARVQVSDDMLWKVFIERIFKPATVKKIVN